MAKEKHNHNHSHAIPSPYPAVTSYEEEFVNVFNRNLAAAMGSVLKYIAQAAADTIKNGIQTSDLITQPLQLPSKNDKKIKKGEDDQLSKGKWNVGDVNPDGKRVWTEYKPGKFGWRWGKDAKEHVSKQGGEVKKKTTSKEKKYKFGEILSELEKMSSKQVQQHLESLNLLSTKRGKNELEKADVNTARQIGSSLIKLHEKISFAPVTVTMASIKELGDATMDAAGGRWIRMRETFFTNFNPNKYYKNISTDFRSQHEDAIKVYERAIKDNKFKIAQLVNSIKEDIKEEVAIYKKQNEYYEKCIEKEKRILEDTTCWTVGEESTLASDIFLHEMGHILNGQCSGSCGVWKTSRYQKVFSDTERALHLQLNRERDDIFKKYLSEKTHISKYSTTKNVEFFAECFVYWVKEDKRLPKYIREYFDKYFKLTNPRL